MAPAVRPVRPAGCRKHIGGGANGVISWQSRGASCKGPCGAWTVGSWRDAQGRSHTLIERLDPAGSGGFVGYGRGLGGTNGRIPELTGRGVPTPYSRVSIELADAPPAGVALVGVGLARGNVPLLGGTLWISGIVVGVGVTTDHTGAASLVLDLPAGPSTLGLDLRFQGFAPDAGAIHGLAMTAGLEMAVR